MTARAAIVDRITDRIQFLAGAAPTVTTVPLLGHWIDGLDLMDLGLWLEDEFELSSDLPLTSTVDTIADLVMAKSSL